jgi:hypothetical protein
VKKKVLPLGKIEKFLIGLFNYVRLNIDCNYLYLDYYNNEFAIVLALSTSIADVSEDMSLCAEHMPPSLAAAALAEAALVEACLETNS